jgi:hypothetical protein
MSANPTDSVPKTSSNHLNRQIAQYSVAAAVAGVSMLALAQPAAGEVVVTKKTINIPMASFRDFTTKISMANNGVNNFSFNLYSFETGTDRGFIMQGVTASDGILGSGFYQKAFALPRGSKIGPGAFPFDPYTALIEATQSGENGSRYPRGDWENSKNRYLGVSFRLNGQTHYGWIRVTVTVNLQPHGPFPTAKITGYAYETVPNKTILAGTAATAAATAEKPTAKLQAPKNIRNQSGPSLGMLAAGAGALPMWRRKENFTGVLEIEG